MRFCPRLSLILTVFSLWFSFGDSAPALAQSCASLFTPQDPWVNALQSKESRWEKFWSFRSKPSDHIENFLPVDAETLKDAAILRGGYPTFAGFQNLQKTLAENGASPIKRVITFLNNKYDLESERAHLAQLGIELISIPVANSSQATPTETIKRILAIMREATPENKVYIHCRHGQDRTGLLAALYKLKVMRAPPLETYREMLRLGFHRILLNLVWTWHREVLALALSVGRDPEIDSEDAPQNRP